MTEYEQPQAPAGAPAGQDGGQGDTPHIPARLLRRLAESGMGMVGKSLYVSIAGEASSTSPQNPSPGSKSTFEVRSFVEHPQATDFSVILDVPKTGRCVRLNGPKPVVAAVSDQASAVTNGAARREIAALPVAPDVRAARDMWFDAFWWSVAGFEKFAHPYYVSLVEVGEFAEQMAAVRDGFRTGKIVGVGHTPTTDYEEVRTDDALYALVATDPSLIAGEPLVALPFSRLAQFRNRLV